MSNMSYCRFRNTDKDLSDCEDALQEMANDPGREPLDGEELEAAKRLVTRCFMIAQLVMEWTPHNGIDEILDAPRTGKIIADAVDKLNNTPKEG